MRSATASWRRPCAAVLAALGVVLAAGACTGTATGSAGPEVSAGSGSSGAPSTAGGASGDRSSEVRGAVTALLAERAAALAAKDKDAWLASVADAGSPFGTAQAALFDRLVALPVTGMTPRQVTLSSSSSSSSSSSLADADVADVRLAYRFDGYDQGDRVFAASYLVSRAAGGWRLTGRGPGRTDPQPFDIDGATSVRSPSTLVIGDVPAATLEAYRALGDAAQAPIAAAWGQARPGVVVVPRTTTELETQLGRGYSAGLTQVAAITDGPLPTGTPAQSDRVYLNPDVMARLTDEGRRVVVTHELTHVTVRGSTTRPVPIWLSEGYADEVAYSDSTTPPATVAAGLLTLVREGKGPTTLPTASDFDPSRGPIDPSYNAAWLAVRLIHDEHGASRLADFYRAVSGGAVRDPAVTGSADDLTRQAFPAVLGVSQDAFVADWRAELARLAG